MHGNLALSSRDIGTEDPFPGSDFLPFPFGFPGAAATDEAASEVFFGDSFLGFSVFPFVSFWPFSSRGWSLSPFFGFSFLGFSFSSFSAFAGFATTLWPPDDCNAFSTCPVFSSNCSISIASSIF